MAGTLYVVATPLGNLEDLSPRAAATLRQVAAVAAEDTRHTKPLLAHAGSHAELVSFHAHSTDAALRRILRLLGGGKDVALVTDAGTPAVSDPGAVLVAAARARDVAVVTVPGPTAVAAALSVSGLAADRYLFLGFLPRKGGERRRLLDLGARLLEHFGQFARHGGAARGPGRSVRRRALRRRGARTDQSVRGDARRDPGRARRLLRRSAAARRGHRPGCGDGQAGAGGGAAPRSGGARPRAARAGHDPPRRSRSTGGGDGDHAQYGVSVGERAVRALAVVLWMLWLPIADGLPKRGTGKSERGTAPTNARASVPRSAFRVPRLATLTIGRLHYDGGGDWYAGPSALPNLLAAIRQRTALPVAERERVVTLTGPELWDVPYLYVTGHGNVRFSDDEVRILRRWLEQGGFLHADDDYGMDKSFRREIARVFPDHPLVEVPLSHPIYHVVYDLPQGTPKIEEHDGLPAQGFGIFLGNRLVVYYDYQADLNDGWEDPDVNHLPPNLREAALRMGVNLFTYAVSTTR